MSKQQGKTGNAKDWRSTIAAILAQARRKPRPRNSRVRYQRAIISYLDILGFKNLVGGRSAPDLYDVLRRFRTAMAPDELEAEHVQLRSVTFSDLNVRVAFVPEDDAPGSPDGYVFWELLGLVLTQIALISDGIVVRGAITFGDVYCRPGVLFGPGLVHAHNMEHDAIFPRIVVAPELLATIERPPLRSRSHSVDEETEFIEDIVSIDDDGQHYLDYLRAAESDLEPEEHLPFLLAHRDLINSSTIANQGDARILEKYEWMRRKHNSALLNLPDELFVYHGLTRAALHIPDK